MLTFLLLGYSIHYLRMGCRKVRNLMSCLPQLTYSISSLLQLQAASNFAFCIFTRLDNVAFHRASSLRSLRSNLGRNTSGGRLLPLPCSPRDLGSSRTPIILPGSEGVNRIIKVLSFCFFATRAQRSLEARTKQPLMLLVGTASLWMEASTRYTGLMRRRYGKG